MHENLYALIMAGGGGTRLWPLSRHIQPKQALQLFGNRTMFQYSVDRLLPLLPTERIFVVTAADQVDLLLSQYPDLTPENFIIEPQGRGTASCIALSALHISRLNPDAVMVVVTADHFVRDNAQFVDALEAAVAIAEQQFLVTLGVCPTYAATGYGYLQQGNRLGFAKNTPFYEVKKFTEKPTADIAQQFLEAGTYFWNSGMFVWKTSQILAEVQSFMPALHKVIEQLGVALTSGNYEAELQALWPRLAKETIDYGIMEKASRVVMLPVDFGWTDIGIWNSVMSMHEADENGNVLIGDILAQDSQRTMVHSHTGRFIATIGVEDLIIIDTPDALLITQRHQCQHVKDIVDYLRKQDRNDLL